MGLLLNYFKSLKSGDIIDDVILMKERQDVGNSNIRDIINDNWTEEGFFIRKYYSWFIPYKENKINFHRVLDGQDAISCDFSGCAMAYFYDPKMSEKYVAHICLLGENEQEDCRKLWINYCKRNPSHYNTKIFIPKAIRCCIPINKSDDLDISPHWYNCHFNKWGLISHTRKCYDIIVEINSNTIYFRQMRESNPLLKGYLPVSEWDYYNIDWISKLSIRKLP